MYKKMKCEKYGLDYDFLVENDILSYHLFNKEANSILFSGKIESDKIQILKKIFTKEKARKIIIIVKNEIIKVVLEDIMFLDGRFNNLVYNVINFSIASKKFQNNENFQDYEVCVFFNYMPFFFRKYIYILINERDKLFIDQLIATEEFAQNHHIPYTYINNLSCIKFLSQLNMDEHTKEQGFDESKIVYEQIPIKNQDNINFKQQNNIQKSNSKSNSFDGINSLEMKRGDKDNSGKNPCKKLEKRNEIRENSQKVSHDSFNKKSKNNNNMKGVKSKSEKSDIKEKNDVSTQTINKGEDRSKNRTKSSKKPQSVQITNKNSPKNIDRLNKDSKNGRVIKSNFNDSNETQEISNQESENTQNFNNNKQENTELKASSHDLEKNTNNLNHFLSNIYNLPKIVEERKEVLKPFQSELELQTPLESRDTNMNVQDAFEDDSSFLSDDSMDGRLNTKFKLYTEVDRTDEIQNLLFGLKFRTNHKKNSCIVYLNSDNSVFHTIILSKLLNLPVINPRISRNKIGNFEFSELCFGHLNFYNNFLPSNRYKGEGYCFFRENYINLVMFAPNTNLKIEIDKFSLENVSFFEVKSNKVDFYFSFKLFPRIYFLDQFENTLYNRMRAEEGFKKAKILDEFLWKRISINEAKMISEVFYDLKISLEMKQIQKVFKESSYSKTTQSDFLDVIFQNMKDMRKNNSSRNNSSRNNSSRSQNYQISTCDTNFLSKNQQKNSNIENKQSEVKNDARNTWLPNQNFAYESKNPQQCNKSFFIKIYDYIYGIESILHKLESWNIKMIHINVMENVLRGLDTRYIDRFVEDIADFNRLYYINIILSKKGSFIYNKLKDKFYLDMFEKYEITRFISYLDINLTNRFCPVESVFDKYAEINAKNNEETGNIFEGINTLLVTPLHTYICYPTSNVSNRVTRNFNPDNFLRVTFKDEDAKNILRSNKYGISLIYDNIERVLSEGVIIGKKKYSFLAMGSNMLKVHSAWFVSPFKLEFKLYGPETIKNWIGNFKNIYSIGKYAVRIGQALSSTVATIDINKIKEIPDIKRNDYCFSDGVGQISLELAHDVSELLLLNEIPSVFQIRIGGYKGVVSLYHKNIEELNETMKKYAEDRLKLLMELKQENENLINQNDVSSLVSNETLNSVESIEKIKCKSFGDCEINEKNFELSAFLNEPAQIGGFNEEGQSSPLKSDNGLVESTEKAIINHSDSYDITHVRPMSENLDIFFQNDFNEQDSMLNGSITSKFYELNLRRSMNKFVSIHKNLEIITWSQYSPCFLNRQIINVLTALGIPEDIFLKYQDRHLESFIKTSKVVLMKAYTSEFDFTGFETNPFFNKLLNIITKQTFNEVVSRSRIFICNARICIGIIDEYSVLAENEIFLQISPCSEICFVKRCDNKEVKIIEGRVCVTRNPCLHPGDARILRCVYKKELSHLKDVVVFSQKGKRPIFDMCSGGDLDGDQYFCTWDTNLLPEKMLEPEDYKQETTIQKISINNDDIIDFFVKYMKENQLGLLAHAHLVLSDKLPGGITEPECKELARLFSIGVDFTKTGTVPIVPFRLKPTEYPDFMQRRIGWYESKKILGKLFRRAFVLENLNYSNCICKRDIDESMSILYDFYCVKLKPVYRKINITKFIRDIECIFESQIDLKSLEQDVILWNKVCTYDADSMNLYVEYKERVMFLMHKYKIVDECELFLGISKNDELDKSGKEEARTTFETYTSILESDIEENDVIYKSLSFLKATLYTCKEEIYSFSWIGHKHFKNNFEFYQRFLKFSEFLLFLKHTKDSLKNLRRLSLNNQDYKKYLIKISSDFDTANRYHNGYSENNMENRQNINQEFENINLNVNSDTESSSYSKESMYHNNINVFSGDSEILEVKDCKHAFPYSVVIENSAIGLVCSKLYNVFDLRKHFDSIKIFKLNENIIFFDPGYLEDRANMFESYKISKKLIVEYDSYDLYEKIHKKLNKTEIMKDTFMILLGLGFLSLRNMSYSLEFLFFLQKVVNIKTEKLRSSQLQAQETCQVHENKAESEKEIFIYMLLFLSKLCIVKDIYEFEKEFDCNFKKEIDIKYSEDWEERGNLLLAASYLLSSPLQIKFKFLQALNLKKETNKRKKDMQN